MGAPSWIERFGRHSKVVTTFSQGTSKECGRASRIRERNLMTGERYVNMYMTRISDWWPICYSAMNMPRSALGSSGDFLPARSRNMFSAQMLLGLTWQGLLEVPLETVLLVPEGLRPNKLSNGKWQMGAPCKCFKASIEEWRTHGRNPPYPFCWLLTVDCNRLYLCWKSDWASLYILPRSSQVQNHSTFLGITSR